MNGVSPEIFAQTQERIEKIEQEKDVKILLAVESGSRAWGFASKDSDYDIRFVYAHKINHYLSIREKRDVIEYPIQGLIDLNGWDIKKALQLFQKGNPSFTEWIKSPIIYKEDENFTKPIREIEQEYFSARKYIYHYLNMARNNYKEYLKKDQVRTKKYFYVLRPILACLWVDKYSTPPPIEFDFLLEAVTISERLKIEIDTLLEKKKNGEELDKGEKIRPINEFLEEKIEYINNKVKTYTEKNIPTEELDLIFRKFIHD